MQTCSGLGLLESLLYGAALGWLIVSVPATVARMARGSDAP